MVFGIDVGGTTVKIGLIENDKIVDKYEIPTCGETFIEDICASLKSYMKEHSSIEDIVIKSRFFVTNCLWYFVRGGTQ